MGLHVTGMHDVLTFAAVILLHCGQLQRQQQYRMANDSDNDSDSSSYYMGGGHNAG